MNLESHESQLVGKYSFLQRHCLFSLRTSFGPFTILGKFKLQLLCRKLLLMATHTSKLGEILETHTVFYKKFR